MTILPFVKPDLHVEDYWRGIVLFGRNVASYKFALAASLLELKPASGDLVRLEDLAGPFTRHLRVHLADADKQITASRSKFLDACRGANREEVDEAELIETAVRLGFVNVIDAFHKVGTDDVPKRFFLDERRDNGGIRITDSFSELLEGSQFSNLPIENEARWKLVETAWELGVSQSLIAVNFDPDIESLFVIDRSRRRKPITGARNALSGYQKGHCFFCFSGFSLLDDAPPDVDHFFPHVLMTRGFDVPLDGVWNLVLACRRCNRGAEGKFAHVPKLRFLERLSRRNEFLIKSHHPLRETLLLQTGRKELERHDFLAMVHREALVSLIHEWEPGEEREELF